MKIRDVNFDTRFVSKLIKTKINLKYSIGYLDKVIRPLVFILPKLSEYFKKFKGNPKFQGMLN